MIRYLKTHTLSDIETSKAPLVLAIGMFDGVHRGHQLVIEQAKMLASKNQYEVGILTFYPHPSHLFTPEKPKALILSQEEKVKIFSDLGLDYCIEQEFTKEFATIKAADFVKSLKTALPHLKAIFVGDNFTYGYKREGTADSLVPMGKEYGIEVNIVQALTDNEGRISSTRIRELIRVGNITAANELLGYPYFYQGPLNTGLARGRTIGFPTLNFPWHNELCPRLGVYAVRLVDTIEHSTLKGGTATGTCGVANIGVRPTFGGDPHPLLEVHLFGKPNYTVGQILRTEFLHFIRPEMRFNSIDELKEQIQKDSDKAYQLLGITH